MERQPPLHFYAPHADAHRLETTGTAPRAERNTKKSMEMVFMEYRRIWSFLYAPFHGLCLRRILVRRSHLANYHRGRHITDTLVWNKDSRQKSSMVGHHPDGNLHSSNQPFPSPGNSRHDTGIFSHPDCGHLLPAGKSKNDAVLSPGFFYSAARLRHDIMQHALLACFVNHCNCHQRTPILRTVMPVFPRGVILRCHCHHPFLRSY